MYWQDIMELFLPMDKRQAAKLLLCMEIFTINIRKELSLVSGSLFIILYRSSIQ